MYYPDGDPGDGGGGIPSITSTLQCLWMNSIAKYVAICDAIDEFLK